MKSKLWMLAAILSCGFLLTSCKDVAGTDDNPVNPEPATPTNIVEQTDFSSYIDMNTYAGDDFYRYAVGKWLTENPLGDKSANGTLAQQSNNTNDFLASLATSTDEVISRLRNDFNVSSVTSDLAIVKEKVNYINSITSIEDMYKAMGQMMLAGYHAPFFFTSVAYERTVSPFFALPENSSFYDLDDESMKKYGGMTDAEVKKTEELIDSWEKLLVDKELIAGKSGRIPRHILESRLVKFNFTLTRAGGSNPLLSIFTSMGFKEDDAKAMVYDEYEHINTFLAKLTLDQLKLFNIYMVLNRDLNYIPQEETDTFKNLLTHLIETKYGPLSVLVSEIYNKTIPAANRTAATAMASEFRKTFKDRINKLTWMSDATKAKAIEKLENMDINIGWPDDESKRADWTVKVPAVVTEGKSSFYTDVLDIFIQQAKIAIKKINSESKEDLFYADEVNSSSFESNAFYSQVNNAVYILSSNLVPPIFDPGRSDAINYSVLGASTIGHEITHGFDPGGKNYDKTGKETPWMTAADALAFDALSNKIIARFNTLSIGDIYKCDGKKTVTENTADLGGLYIGYDAFMNLLDKKGVTGAERDRQGREFFRGFAYAWMGNLSEKKIKSYAKDPHSPHALRVNGNVYLMDEFYRLFNISSGNMYLAPADRLVIW